MPLSDAGTTKEKAKKKGKKHEHLDRYMEKASYKFYLTFIYHL